MINVLEIITKVHYYTYKSASVSIRGAASKMI